jgi:hypothetical protein
MVGGRWGGEMSYIRFGEDGSDVYIYGDCNGKICCCGCGINEADEYRSMYFDKISDLLKHLKENKMEKRFKKGTIEPKAGGVYYRLFSPIYYNDGDGIDIVLHVKFWEFKIIVTDLGMTLGDCEMRSELNQWTGEEKDTSKLYTMIKSYIFEGLNSPGGAHGFKFEKGEIFKEITIRPTILFIMELVDAILSLQTLISMVAIKIKAKQGWT